MKRLKIVGESGESTIVVAQLELYPPTDAAGAATDATRTATSATPSADDEAKVSILDLSDYPSQPDEQPGWLRSRIASALATGAHTLRCEWPSAPPHADLQPFFEVGFSLVALRDG